MQRAMKQLDLRISQFMRQWSGIVLRGSLAVVFIWFGILKPLGISPAEPLVRLTVASMPIFSTDVWVSVIGWWEVAIGIFFLFRSTTRVAIALLALQMVGTFLPLALLPEITFQEHGLPVALTMEGQYIVKNLLIISAALVIGGSLGTNSSLPTESQGSGHVTRGQRRKTAVRTLSRVHST